MRGLGGLQTHDSIYCLVTRVPSRNSVFVLGTPRTSLLDPVMYLPDFVGAARSAEHFLYVPEGHSPRRLDDSREFTIRKLDSIVRGDVASLILCGLAITGSQDTDHLCSARRYDDREWGGSGRDLDGVCGLHRDQWVGVDAVADRLL